MTKEQADEINRVFEKQKNKIKQLEAENDSLKIIVSQQDEWIYGVVEMIKEYESTLKKYDKIIKNWEEKKTTIFYWDDVTDQTEVYTTTQYIAFRNRKGKLKIKKLY